MYLTGQLDLSGLGAVDTNTYALLGTFYSMFSRQVVNANGTVLETIERPGELVNMLVNMTMNAAEKIAQTNSLGTFTQRVADDSTLDATTNIGGPLFNASASLGINNGNTVTFAIPIIGIFDANKYIPMWNSNIDLELTINAVANWLTIILGSYQTSAAFTLSNLELVFDSIELSPESFNMVMANYPQKVVIKTASYLAGNSVQFSGGGAQDIPINARLSSMKQLFFYFNQVVGAVGTSACADQTFGGVNPNGQDVVFCYKWKILSTKTG